MLRVGALAVACAACFRISVERGELVMSIVECPLIVGREVVVQYGGAEAQALPSHDPAGTRATTRSYVVTTVWNEKSQLGTRGLAWLRRPSYTHTNIPC
jgi:hypothetical protein